MCVCICVQVTYPKKSDLPKLADPSSQQTSFGISSGPGPTLGRGSAYLSLTKTPAMW